MILNGLSKLTGTIIEPLFNNHQESLVHAQSHLRIIRKKLLYFISFKRVNFRRLHADGINGINPVLNHGRPAKRKSGLDGANAGGHLV